jgi:hypothetical protein
MQTQPREVAYLHDKRPSSIREVLHRELYQGVIVRNRTRKCDQWGRKQQSAQPVADWLRIATTVPPFVSTGLVLPMTEANDGVLSAFEEQLLNPP